MTVFVVEDVIETRAALDRFRVRLNVILLCSDFVLGAVEVHPETIYATCGEQVEINCMTESEDQPGVEWEFVRVGSNRPIAICTGATLNFIHGSKYACKKETNRHTLIINNVTFNDSGILTCTEDEGRGPGTDSSHLHVIACCK